MRTLTIQEAVWQAAESLMSQGIRPTVANVREITQRGSAGTINDSLKEWWQDLAKRINVNAIHPDIPEPVVAVMQQLWHVALTHGESAFDKFKEEAQLQVDNAQQSKIAALERLQHADNQMTHLQAKIDVLKESERQLQTTLATESALRSQSEQQLEAVRLHSQKALSDVETLKSQLEKELALLAAQYQHSEQQFNEKNQQLEQQLQQQHQDFVAQSHAQQQFLQASELRATQTDMQLLQAQTELRMTQQRLENCLLENMALKATLQRPIQKRDVLKAKLKRY
ncbi:hypothetical protein FK216_01465 [Moraxellaceae bacterium AER2_44_116]|nr:DNA-binding protein [Moraxellaceae bacterium]TQC99940.1 hypothetical protein FK216_01465 [Moraxellaceae bacterium AER2_44_116]